MTARPFIVAVALVATATTARGQVPVPPEPARQEAREGERSQEIAAALVRALEHESAGRLREAADAFRFALQNDVLGATLGLERVHAAMGRTEELLPTIDSLVAAHPQQWLLRTVQLRALHMAGRDAGLATAFEAWISQAPRDPAPYRDYARLLLESGRASAADTVIERARRALGTTRGVALELAQLRARQERWEEAAASWREALSGAPYLEQAALFSLQQVPAERRDSVRGVLADAAMEPPMRRTLARLEIAWGDLGAGWETLRALPAGDSTVVAWESFADEAELVGAWSAAARARAAIHRARPGLPTALSAARAALAAGDAAAALELTAPVARIRRPAEADSVARELLVERVRALSALGRPAEAERLVRALGADDRELDRALQRELAWAWVRGGDLDRARDALVRSGVDADDAVHGWLALYSGDLAGAREGLRGATPFTGRMASGGAIGADAVLALAVLARTTDERAPAIGAAFLALARRDTASAAEEFARAANEHADAAPTLLATAARLLAARGAAARATAIWERLVVEHPATAEAAEAQLAWARHLRQAGDREGAIARLENLIISHPESALAPQARRELELLRAATSGGSRGATGSASH